MSRAPGGSPPPEPFEEKDFYLEEFRGRSALVALAPAVTDADLGSLASAVADLVRNDTRVFLWWPAAERRLLAALRRSRALARPRKDRRPQVPVVRLDAAGPAASPETLRAALWLAARRARLCVLTVSASGSFPRDAVELAIELRVPTLVLVDPRGGLDVGAGRLSFVDENLLDTLLRRGEAEWSGLGERRVLLAGVGAALAGGVESVNLCTPEGVAEELFTYVGSGTLFPQGDYCHVA